MPHASSTVLPAQRKDAERVRDFLVQHTPHKIFLGGSCMRCVQLYEDLKQVLDHILDKMPSLFTRMETGYIELDWADESLAALWETSEAALQEMGDQLPLTRRAVSARAISEIRSATFLSGVQLFQHRIRAVWQGSLCTLLLCRCPQLLCRDAKSNADKVFLQLCRIALSPASDRVGLPGRADRAGALQAGAPGGAGGAVRAARGDTVHGPAPAKGAAAAPGPAHGSRAHLHHSRQPGEGPGARCC